MTSVKIKQEFDIYFPLLTLKQQKLIVNLVKNILNVDATEKSILSRQNKKALDKTLADHKAGKLKYYTVQQAKKILYGKSKKIIEPF
jgi:hypothetical protein